MKLEGHQEGETSYIKGTKCHKLFCFRQATYKKLIFNFPCVARYVPTCDKHK